VSISCLCRKSSIIRIRVADVFPFMLSVATLYIWHMVAALRSYGLCGVACRVLLRVLSRFVTTLRSLFAAFWGFQMGSVTDVRRQLVRTQFRSDRNDLLSLGLGFTLLHIVCYTTMFIQYLWGVGFPV
jgi:hypothetical protein